MQGRANTLSRRSFLASSAGVAAMGLCPGFSVASGPTSDENVTFLTPASDGYARYATPFNARIKTRPGLIAVCRSEAGVVRAVAHANAADLAVAIKSGGHSFEGYSLNANGLVIDVSQLNEQRLDEQDYTAGPGVKLSQAYDFLLPRGRLIPMGSCGTVGLSGLTLGGGYGLFSRKFGLTCDNLTGVRMVDGQGNLRDSADDDWLIWACRGGGNGNFGIVTQLRYRTHPAPLTLPRRRIRFRNLTADTAASIAQRWFTLTAMLPEDTFSAFVLNGSTLTILITYFDPASATRIDAAERELVLVGGTAARHANEPIARAVQRYYGATQPLHFKNVSAGFYRGYDDLRPGIADIFGDVIDEPGMIFQINTLGGAVADPARYPLSAYPHRDYPYLGELQSYWDTDAQTERRVAAINRVQQKLHALGIRKHYRNYPSAELPDWADAYYGPQVYAALQQCKAAYDPANRITHTQSVRP